jgi:hypothetical protein
MANGPHENDTDPSTPVAMRGSGDADAPKVSTDPGLGPPSAPAQPARDPVELMIENRGEPRPLPPKTRPQTDGESSAAYHVEHAVKPATTTPDEEPKVVVERVPLAPTLRVSREKLQGVIEEADALRSRREAEAAAAERAAAEAAGVGGGGMGMGPRVLLALVAGLAVVGVIFVVVAVSRTATPTPTPTPTPTTTTTTTTMVTATPTATIATVPASALPIAQPPPTVPTAKPRPKPSATGDIGEFKPNF